MMLDMGDESEFERGFRAGYEAGLMAAANGAKPEFMFADTEMARRFGLRSGQKVKVMYDEQGNVIGAFGL